MIDKNLILIKYLQSLTSDYTFKSEYSTNDQDLKVVVVSVRPTEKEVLYDGKKLFDAFQVEIFGDSIRSEKDLAVTIGELIGDNVTIAYEGSNYQIMFQQISNPQSIMYEDIRRVGYTLILRTLINEI